MIIFEDQTDRLLDAVGQVQAGATAQGCLHITLTGTASSAEMAALLQCVTKTVHSSEGLVFIRGVKDIFAMAEEINSSTLANLKAAIAAACGGGDVTSPERITFYETGSNWPLLLRLVREMRLEEIEYSRRMERERETARRSQLRKSVLNMPVSDDMVSSLRSRREERDRLELMLVEDDSFSRSLVRMALMPAYSVSQVSDGHSCLATYARVAPDILFLDIGLPDVSGLDILKKILEIDPQAYVVMLSGYGDRDNIAKAMEYGAKGFVSKPFSKAKLIEYIERGTAGKRRKAKETT